MEQLDGCRKNIRFWELAQEHEVLPIHTEPKLRSRALRFMNTLILVVEAMNGNIVFEYGNCYIRMFGQKTKINLRQKYHRIREKDKSGWSRESWEKSNKLEFQVGPSFNQKNWIDRKTIRLEGYLPQIIAWIEKDCKYWHDLRAEQAIEENKKALQKQKTEATKKAQELEQTKFKQLICNAENWQKALLLEDYLNEMEKQLKLENKLNPQTTNYIKWAREKAIQLNPLMHKN